MSEGRLAEVVGMIRGHFRSLDRPIGEPLLNAFTELEYDVVARLRAGAHRGCFCLYCNPPEPKRQTTDLRDTV